MGDFLFSCASSSLLTGELQPCCQQSCSGVCHVIPYWPQFGQPNWKRREASVLWHEVQLLTLPDFVPREQHAITFEQNSTQYYEVSRIQCVCPAVGTNRNSSVPYTEVLEAQIRPTSALSLTTEKSRLCKKADGSVMPTAWWRRGQVLVSLP